MRVTVFGLHVTRMEFKFCQVCVKKISLLVDKYTCAHENIVLCVHCTLNSFNARWVNGCVCWGTHLGVGTSSSFFSFPSWLGLRCGGGLALIFTPSSIFIAAPSPLILSLECLAWKIRGIKCHSINSVVKMAIYLAIYKLFVYGFFYCPKCIMHSKSHFFVWENASAPVPESLQRGGGPPRPKRP